MSQLTLRNINTGYDKKQILFDVSLDVEKGESILLIGSNGSGKSTLFKAIYGILPLWKNDGRKQGEIIFEGNSIVDVPTHQLIKRGIMYIPQKHELFEDMTVRENLIISTLHLNNKKESEDRLEDVLEKIPIIKEKIYQKAINLSGGERKLLSLAMLITNNPKLAMLDEPLAGLSGLNKKKVIDILKEISNSGVSSIIIEHQIKELAEVVDRIIGCRLGNIVSNINSDINNIKSFLI